MWMKGWIAILFIWIGIYATKGENEHPCRYEHCSGHGICTDHNHHAHCHCNHGYEGNRCQDDVCQTQTCSNNGQCSLTTTSPYWECTCNDGYQGDTCHENVCQTQTCSNNGHCSFTSSLPYWECTCNDGYQGDTCHERSFKTCDKVALVGDIVMHNITTNGEAATCKTGTTDSPEAFVLNHCSVAPPTASWQKGVQVMSSANCSSTPMYTPVAMFTGSQYVASASDNVTGAYVGCLPTGGFKLAVQQCGEHPKIVHIESTSDLYYAII